MDITVAPLDDWKFFLGMDFVNNAKAIIVPYASTFFIMGNGQAHAIAMRSEAEKGKILISLCSMDSKEVGHLYALKRDEGPMSVVPPTSPTKLAQRRKRARTRMGCKRVKDRCTEEITTTYHPN